MTTLVDSYRFAAAGGGWTPADLTGLLAWYDASDAGSFTYSSGVLVSQWDDLSGNAHHMTGASSSEPQRTGTQNSLGIVEFTASSGQYLTMPNAFASLTQVTVYLVLKTRNDPPSVGDYSGLMHFYTAAENTHYPFTDGNAYVGLGSTTRKSTGSPSDALNAWHTLAVSSASADWNMRVNGASHYSTGTNTVGINTNPKFGYQSDTGNVYYDGWLAEMVITEDTYDSAFDTYAATKWGL
jgi:hypothetical protein